jgi:hypothetical protein
MIKALEAIAADMGAFDDDAEALKRLLSDIDEGAKKPRASNSVRRCNWSPRAMKSSATAKPWSSTPLPFASAIWLPVPISIKLPTNSQPCHRVGSAPFSKPSKPHLETNGSQKSSRYSIRSALVVSRKSHAS